MTVRVVVIDDCAVADVEKLRLGLKVVLHGLVVVQMILSEVCKHRHLVMAVTDAMLVQRMRGNLHHAELAASVYHPGVEPF